MFRDYEFKRYDFILVILVIALVCFGIIAIKSATLSSIDGTSTFVKKQIIGFAVGFVLMIVISIFSYRFVAKFYWLIYLLNIGLLVAVLLFGKTVNGAQRWVEIGGFTIQSSEFCKIFLTIFLAKFIDKYKSKLNKIWFLAIVLALAAIPIYLIFIQPNLSTTIVVTVMTAIIIFAAGIRFRYILIAIVIVVPASIFGLWYIQQPDQKLLEPYQVKRITTMFYPDEASASDKMQTRNSMQAIGSGQLFGKGLYQGKLNKYNYLPEPQTDFIFAIIGEEFGFVGCSVVLALILCVILRCLWIAKDAKDLTALLIIVGFVSVLTFQTFIHVGVDTGMLPNTGIPLPFISYGSSSLWSNMIALGLILNISMQRKSNYFEYEKE